MLYHIEESTKFTPDRHHTELVADFPEGRLAVFSLEPGHIVDGHQAPARVLMYVVLGRGELVVGDEVLAVKPGDMANVDPYVTHGMRASEERFVVMAVIIRM